MNETFLPGQRGSATGFWLIACVLLACLQCASIWSVDYFPSQDGPSHLHNAAVMAHYNTEPLYRQYYEVLPFHPAGNMLSQYMAAAMLRITSPAVTEKVVLSAYILLFYISFLYLLSAYTNAAHYFLVFAGILAPNWFLYMGFWNFLLSMPLSMLVIGYVVRRQNRWAVSSLPILVIAGTVLYITHALSWAITVMTVAVLGLPVIIPSIRSSEQRRRAVAQFMLPICGLLPPLILLVTHVSSAAANGTAACVEPSLHERLWTVYSLTSLQVISQWDEPLRRLIAGFVAVAAAYVLWNSLRKRRYVWSSTWLLLVSGLCTGIAVALPTCIGAGLFTFRPRFAFYGLLFVPVWLSASLSNWPRSALNGIAACGVALNLLILAGTIPALSAWNQRLSEVVRVGEHIRRGSTVLMVNVDCLNEVADPYRHAVGLLSPRTIIDLSNYEAAADHFVTRFRPERSPFPALGTLKELEGTPPRFDPCRYERTTAGQVDYLLFRRSTGDPKGTGEIEARYREQLSGFTRVPTEDAQARHLTLYERSPSQSSACLAAN